ncbi:MAG TPA: hypothetical protein VKH45_11770, partial [Candidatus Acidoferrum sp.]|nr:hypothetical protein [Candidatus Acidoferrum sp.]
SKLFHLAALRVSRVAKLCDEADSPFSLQMDGHSIESISPPSTEPSHGHFDGNDDFVPHRSKLF